MYRMQNMSDLLPGVVPTHTQMHSFEFAGGHFDQPGEHDFIFYFAREIIVFHLSRGIGGVGIQVGREGKHIILLDE